MTTAQKTYRAPCRTCFPSVNHPNRKNLAWRNSSQSCRHFLDASFGQANRSVSGTVTVFQNTLTEFQVPEGSSCQRNLFRPSPQKLPATLRKLHHHCLQFCLAWSCGGRWERRLPSMFARCSTDFHSDVHGFHPKKLLYFEWSPPWHVGWRLSGEGCHWEYDGKNGEFENIDFRFPWLSDTSEMGFGHDVPFLNYSDRLPHPSDLCQPDRVRGG